jgi:hypothetical protein
MGFEMPCSSYPYMSLRTTTLLVSGNIVTHSIADQVDSVMKA